MESPEDRHPSPSRGADQHDHLHQENHTQADGGRTHDSHAHGRRGLWLLIGQQRAVSRQAGHHPADHQTRHPDHCHRRSGLRPIRAGQQARIRQGLRGGRGLCSGRENGLRQGARHLDPDHLRCRHRPGKQGLRSEHPAVLHHLGAPTGCGLHAQLLQLHPVAGGQKKLSICFRNLPCPDQGRQDRSHGRLHLLRDGPQAGQA